MITLMRDGIVMEVATELQASVFLRSGYKRVDKAPEDNTPNKERFTRDTEKTDKDPFSQFMNEPETATKDTETAPKADPESVSPVEAPKRRRRRKQPE